MSRARLIAAQAALALTLAACGSPDYVEKTDKPAERGMFMAEPVAFKLHQAYRDNPPDCVAILPLTMKAGADDKPVAADAKIDHAGMVRRALYAHLAPQGKRDVELPRVDFLLKGLNDDERKNLPEIARRLNCSTLLSGEVTEFGSLYAGVYSRIGIAADLRLVRASDGVLLWEGSHVAESHGGSVAITPVGLAISLADAASNVREEQTLRVIDDLARRLIGTIPDDRIAVLDEPLAPPAPPAAPVAETADSFLAALKDKPLAERESAIQAALAPQRFDAPGTAKLHQALIALEPARAEFHGGYARFLVGQGDYAGALGETDTALGLNRADPATHFLKGRILTRLQDMDGAERSMIDAAVLDNKSADYFNGLGYVSSLKGNEQRALAAYQMAIDRDPGNGFAYYNLGVTHFNAGSREDAAAAFFEAGKAYLAHADYGNVGKVVTNLRELAQDGLSLDKEIGDLEGALKDIAKKGEKNA